MPSKKKVVEEPVEEEEVSEEEVKDNKLADRLAKFKKLQGMMAS